MLKRASPRRASLSMRGCSGSTTCSSRSNTWATPPRTRKDFRCKPRKSQSVFASAGVSTMISKPSADCFVYIVPPGQTEFVTAGRFELTTDRRETALGRFVYGKSYLARGDAVEIDPVELKLSGATYETTRLDGIFGALRDAGPDYWGRRVIEKHAGKPLLGELDYLLESPDDRAGALGFGLGQEPPAPKRKFNQTINLARLQAIADAIVNDEELPAEREIAQAEELLLVGTSMGGARPKATVEDDDGLWIAKLNRPDDKWN